MKRVTSGTYTITGMICCSKEEAKKQKRDDDGNDDDDVNKRDDLKSLMESFPVEIQLQIFDSILHLRTQPHQCRVDALIETIKEASGFDDEEENENLDEISDTQVIYSIEEEGYYEDITHKKDEQDSINNLPDKIRLAIHVFNVAFDKLADISQVTLKKRVFHGFQDVPLLDIEVITPSECYYIYYDATNYEYICHHSGYDDDTLRVDGNIHKNMRRMEEFLSLGSDRWLEDRDSYETILEEDDDYEGYISLFHTLKKQVSETSGYDQSVPDEFTMLRMELSKK